MTDAPPLKYVWYGDDFTGASDTLATLASDGLRALLCLGVPTPERLAPMGPLDAVGIAGSARTMSPAEMIGELEPVGRYAAAARVPLVHYKCCSTFDSSPMVGSLGAAMRILKRHLPNPFTPVIGGQPSLERYCAFGNLFAAAGHGGEVVRLDRHPTMSKHPSTPMGEADLRWHLHAQGVDNVALVDWRRLGTATVDELDRLVDHSGPDGGSADAVLFDALDASHLARIGDIIWRRALEQPLLAVGASSVAQATLSYWRRIGWARDRARETLVRPASGPVFVLVGSQSPVSARQAAMALDSGSYHGISVNPSLPDSNAFDFEEQAIACVRVLDQGRSVMAWLGPVADSGPSQVEMARACGRMLKTVLERAPQVRRVGIAGGDTSSLAVDALGIWALGFVGALAPGVSLARAHADDPRRDGLELMLKGGQMGAADIFARLLHGTI